MSNILSQKLVNLLMKAKIGHLNEMKGVLSIKNARHTKIFTKNTQNTNIIDNFFNNNKGPRAHVNESLN